MFLGSAWKGEGKKQEWADGEAGLQCSLGVASEAHRELTAGPHFKAAPMWHETFIALPVSDWMSPTPPPGGV